MGRGGMSLWTPANLSIPARGWYDASDAATVVVDAGAVSAWNDKTASGNHLSSTSTARPSYQAAGWSNGMPTIRFDGVDDFLGRESGGPSSQGDFFYAAVFRFLASRAWQTVVHHTDNLTSQKGGLFLQQRNTTKQIGGHNSGRVDSGVFVDTGANLLAHRFATIGRNGGVAGTGNGGIVTVTSADLSTTGTQSWSTSLASTRIVIGGRQQSGSPQFLNGEVSEVVVMDYAPSTADRQRIEGYFSHKWGIASTLAIDHPFRNSPPVTGALRRKHAAAHFFTSRF